MERIKRFRKAYPTETAVLTDRECTALLDDAKKTKKAIDKKIENRAG